MLTNIISQKKYFIVQKYDKEKKFNFICNIWKYIGQDQYDT